MLDGTKGLYGDGYERVLREMALDDLNGALCQPPQGTAGRRQEVGGTESQSPKLIVVSDSDGYRNL